MHAMNNAAIELSQKDKFPTDEVSDDALEISGRSGNKCASNFTLGACTGLSVCDG